MITIWPPMRPIERELLEEEFRRFEQANPGIRMRGLYKELKSCGAASRRPRLPVLAPTWSTARPTY